MCKKEAFLRAKLRHITNYLDSKDVIIDDFFGKKTVISV